MSNPLSVASLATFPLGPGQSTDNRTALPNGQAKGLGALGTTLVQYYDDIVAPIQIKSGTAGREPPRCFWCAARAASAGRMG